MRTAYAPTKSENQDAHQQHHPVGWRDVLPVHPAADLFPLIGKAELRELADDIAKHGLQEKVDLYRDETGKEFLLDGRNRLDALALIGRSRAEAFNYVNSAGDGFDPVSYVVSKNVHRRHLTPEQRRDLIAKLLKATPEISNLQIAKQVKADDKTVAKIRTELESRSEIPNVKKRTDTKGRKQSATKKRVTRKVARSIVRARPTPDMESARALAEFKFAAEAWWPKMNKKHHEEAISFVTGLANKLIEKIANTHDRCARIKLSPRSRAQDQGRT